MSRSMAFRGDTGSSAAGVDADATSASTAASGARRDGRVPNDALGGARSPRALRARRPPRVARQGPHDRPLGVAPVLAGGRRGRAPALVGAAVAQERDEVRRVAHLAAAQGRGRRGRPRVRPPDRREVRGVERHRLRRDGGGAARRRFLLGFRFEHLHRDAAEAPEEALQRHRVGRAGGGARPRPRRLGWRRGPRRAPAAAVAFLASSPCAAGWRSARACHFLSPW